ncbi:MAG: methyltransferase [Campylobacteraceae bacterium]|jgi:tRNA1(Val) A37 N6-methylase TrmN6|nr:methyltransferase [Campylobacteraceae bacterium]
MNLYQYKNGYRYTSDVMFLYAFARSFRPKGNILDIGCGCGILGLLLKRDFPSVNLNAIDIQKEHIRLALKNVQENVLSANVILGDFTKFDFSEKFDFIVSNPPFYHESTKKSKDESLKISRYANSLPLQEFLLKSAMLLKQKGFFIFCYDSKQISDIILQSNIAKLKICDICFVYPKKERESSLVLVAARKDSNAFTKIHSPVFVFEDNEYSKEAKEIFRLADTRSIDWE